MSNINKKPNNIALVLGLFLIFAAFIMAGGWWWYNNQKQLTKKNWEETLDSIAELKKNQINGWQQERINDALITSQWSMIKSYLQNQKFSYKEKIALITRLKMLVNLYDYDNILILNNKGEVVISLNENFLGTLSPATLQLFHRALKEKKIFLGSYYYCQHHQTVHLDLIAPVVVKQGDRDEVVGGLIFILDPGKFLYPLIQSWPTPSPTGETLMVQAEGDSILFLNELRHSKSGPLTIKIPLTEESLPAVRAVEGWQGAMQGKDYRGVPVLAVTKAIPGTPWRMVAKIDMGEIYQPLFREAQLIITGVIVLILLVGAVLGWTLSDQRQKHFAAMYHLEQERQALLQHFEYLVKYANDIILLMDREGSLKEVNERAVAAYGYPREELLQLNIRDLVTENETPAFLRWSTEDLAESGRIYEVNQRRKDGSVFPVEVSVNLIQVEGEHYFQEIVRDITERKQGEKELRESEERFRLLIENAPEAIFVQTQYRFAYLNQAAIQYFGAESAEQLLGQPVLDRFDPSFHELMRERIRLLNEEKLPVGQLEQVYLKMNGLPFQVEVAAVPIHWKGDDGALVFCRDITERKRMEEELRRNQTILAIRNRVAEVFLTVSDDEMYAGVLAVILEALESEYGVFGYLDEEGSLVVPTMTRTIWEKCQVADKRFIFPRNTWGESSWPRAIREKRAICQNEPSTLTPEGHVPVTRHISLPVIHQNEVVGLIQVANKPTDYTAEDMALLESIGGAIAPVLDARLKGARHEAARQQAEKELRLKERLLDGASDSIFLHDLEGRFLYLNKAAYEDRGYEKEELLAQDISMLMSPEFALQREEILQELETQGEIIFESAHLRKDGGVLPVEIHARTFDLGDQKLILSAARDITERKQAEEKLLKAKQFSETIVDSLPGVFYAFDDQGRFLRWNDNFERVTGYSTAEFAELTPLDFFAGEEKTMIEWAIREVFSTGASMAEAELITKDGRKIPYFFTGRRLDLDGTSCVLGTGIDLAARKRAEEALKKSEATLTTILRTAPIGIVLGKNRLIEWHNDYFLKMTGYDPEELQGQSARILYESDEEFTRVEQALFDTILDREGTPMETRFRRKDGSVIDVLMSAAPIAPARLSEGIIVSIMDITVRKRAEEAFAALVNHAPMGIFIVQDGKFKVVNPGFMRICGYAEEELIGSRSLNLVAPDYQEEVRRNAIRMLKGECQTPYEFPIITKSGETRWVVEKVTSTVYQGKRASLGYFLDISEHKSLEGQFLQAQKMEAVGRLAGGVAHDFNNMLNVIMGYSEIMSMDLKQHDALARNLSEIKRAAVRAASLTQQLLAFSRKQLFQPQIINLNDEIVGIKKMLRRLIGEDIEMLVVLDPSLGLVKADPGQIEQIIMNLVVNSRDALPRGGKIILETANVFLDQDYVRTHAYVNSGHYVMMAVTDNGQGMDATTKARIFEPFFTTKEYGQGTGLGLCTAYGIVKQNGGHIQVYSEIGQGTSFKIYLPQVWEEVSETPPTESRVKELRGSETIMVVEDEDMVRKLICQTLDQFGYKVLEAGNGGEAPLLSENYDGKIHLLLTDVVMPQTNVCDLVDRLKPRRPEMKVLYMSGYTQTAVAHYGITASEVSFIQKPFSPKILVEKIRQVLNGAAN